MMSDNSKLLFVLAIFVGILLYTDGYMYFNPYLTGDLRL
jgi:hypothetical protein